MRELWKQAKEALQRGKQFVTHDVWHIGLPGEEVPHGLIIKQVRVIILLFRGIVEETLLLRASALTFATMLFLVPFLALMFYFIQTFDLGDQFYLSMSEKMEEGVSWVASIVDTDEEAPTPPEGTTNPEDSTPAEPGILERAATADSDENNALLEQQLLAALFPIFSSQDGLADESLGQNPVKFLAELAEKGATNPQAVTLTGLLFVLSTVFGFMRNVESSFNRIWGVKRTRNLFRAVSDYMMITLVLPFVAAAVLGITAALESELIVEALGPLAILLRGGQFMVICFTFALLYFFVPNTKVKFRFAIMGGIVAGVLWALSSWGYVKFQIGLARYALFFSGFALFPLLLMWIYVSWLILLFGALLTFAYQNEKTFAMERLAEGASYAYREALAVRTMVELARRFKSGLPGLTLTEAAEAWNVPTRLLHETLDCLAGANLVAVCATEPVRYQPARAPETTKLLDVVHAVRESGRDPSLLREDKDYRPVYSGMESGDQDCLTATIASLATRLDGGETEA